MAESTDTPVQVAQKPRRRSRQALRLGILAIIVATILLAIFFLLPTWANTREGRKFVLHRINNHIQGKLSVQSWSLGWFSGMTLRGVTLRNTTGHVVLRCTVLQTRLTLWSMLFGSYDCGNTQVEHLTLNLQRHRDGANSLDRILATKAKHGLGPLAQFVQHVGKSLRGVINLHSSQITLAARGVGPPITLRRVGGRVEIASPDAPLRITLHGESFLKNQIAPFFVSGNFPPIRRWFVEPLAMLQQMQTEAGAIPVATAAAYLGLNPQWQGAFGPVLSRVMIISRRQRVAPGFHMLPTINTTVQLDGPLGSLAVRGRIVPQQRVGVGYAHALLEVPPDRGYYAQARLATAAPVRRLLAYASPVLADVNNTATMHVEVQRLWVRVGDMAQARGALVLRLSHVRIQPGGLLRSLMTLAAGAGAHVSPKLTTVRVAPLRVRLRHGAAWCRKSTLKFANGMRIVCSGHVGFNGMLGLIATVPFAADAGQLGSASIKMPIVGTLARPVLESLQPLGPFQGRTP